MQQGLLIALEGIDGAGTTTQIPRLAEHVRARGREVVTTAEPTQGPVGRLIRQALGDDAAWSEAALALLFAADRLEHLRGIVLPALAAGQVVLTDRYLLSSFAYQAARLSRAWVEEVNAQARLPDVSIFFRVAPHIAAERRAKRGTGKERFDDTQRQEDVAAAYEALINLSHVGPVRVIDASVDVDQVFARVCHVVDDILREKDGA